MASFWTASRPAHSTLFANFDMSAKTSLKYSISFEKLKRIFRYWYFAAKDSLQRFNARYRKALHAYRTPGIGQGEVNCRFWRQLLWCVLRAMVSWTSTMRGLTQSIAVCQVIFCSSWRRSWNRGCLGGRLEASWVRGFGLTGATGGHP